MMLWSRISIASGVSAMGAMPFWRAWELLAEDGGGEDEGQVEGLAWFDVYVHGVGGSGCYHRCQGCYSYDGMPIFGPNPWTHGRTGLVEAWYRQSAKSSSQRRKPSRTAWPAAPRPPQRPRTLPDFPRANSQPTLSISVFFHGRSGLGMSSSLRLDW